MFFLFYMGRPGGFWRIGAGLPQLERPWRRGRWKFSTGWHRKVGPYSTEKKGAITILGVDLIPGLRPGMGGTPPPPPRRGGEGGVRVEPW